MVNLGFLNLTGKKGDNPYARVVEKNTKELEAMYKKVVIVPNDQRMIITKLRDEFFKESGIQKKKQAVELDPIMKEYSALIDASEKLRNEVIRPMGRRHREEQQQLAAKYIELEMKIIKPIADAKK